MGVFELSMMEWLQSMIVVWGVILLFGYYLYNKFPKVFKKGSGVFKRMLKLKSKKDSKKDKENVKYTDEEMIDIIQGSIKRYQKKDEYTAKQCIKRIKEIVD